MFVLLMAAKVGSYCSLLVGVRNTALSRAWPHELDGLVESSLFQKSDALGGYRQARSLIEAKSEAGAEQSRLLAA